MAKSPSKWSGAIFFGFIAVVAIGISAQRKPCYTCPLTQTLKGQKTCQIAEPNATLSNQQPNSKQTQSAR